MAQYRRIVSYLYKYKGGRKAENTGFVRAEMREEGLRFQFSLKDLKMMDERILRVYFYFHEASRLKTIFVDEFVCLRGNCEYKKLISPEKLEVDFDKISGVIFCDEKRLLYGSCWDEMEIREELIDFETKEEKTTQEEPVMQELVSEEPVRKENLDEEETIRESGLHTSEIKTQTPMQTLFQSFPQITLKDHPEYIEASKIDLADISKLSWKDWKLAENAFLRQGYENYHYLLLGKIEMKSGQEIWVLGVPGTFDNREKYLANIFGFFDYIPEEKNKFRTGGRGYWITRLTELES